MSVRVVARTRQTLVMLTLDEVWAFEAKDRMVFVHSEFGKFDVDVSLLEIESSLGPALFRVHRNWLANVDKIRELVAGCRPCHIWVGNWGRDRGQRICVPVSTEHATALRKRLLANSIGLRRSRA